MGGQRGRERAHMPSRFRHTGADERVEDDGPVGPPRHGRHILQVAPEQLPERHPI